MALMIVSHNLQSGLCVLQIVWVSNIEAQWCSCMAKQMEMVKRQHKCTEPHTLRGSTTLSHNIWSHLSAFVWTWFFETDENAGGRKLCIHQMWRNMFSMILRTTIVQAPGKCPPPPWCMSNTGVAKGGVLGVQTPPEISKILPCAHSWVLRGIFCL